MTEPVDTNDAPAGRRRGARRPAGWALGLPALGLLGAVAVLHTGPVVERDIRRELVRIAGRDAASPLARYRARTEVDGRDVAIVADLGLAEDVRLSTEARVRAVPGIRSVRTVVTAPVALAPFRLSIRRGPAGIVLAGGVPSAEARGALVEAAGRLTAPDLVEDRLFLATGAPAGFVEAAALLLAALGPVESGEVSLADGAFRVRASAPDRARYRAILEALRVLPDGYRAEAVEIEPPLADPFGWSARRDPDGLALAGSVPSEQARADLLLLAAATLPGVPVRDAMETARGLDRRVDFAALSRAALAALASIRGGEATLARRRFTFAGEAVAKAELAAIAGRIRKSLPAEVEAGPIAIVAVPASPFTLTARRSAGRVVLSGYVPDEAGRREMGALVRARFPGERLVDDLTVADGAPAGFPEATRAALEALTDFADGAVAIRDRELRLDGRVLYGQLAARVRRSAPGLAPAGWTAAATVEPPPPFGAIDPIVCGDLLADAARRTPVRFAAGQAVPSGPGLDATADIVRRCGRIAIRVVHQVAAGPDPAAARTLAADRARALVTAFGERGATARLTGEGDLAPGAEPPAAQDRTAFVVAAP